MNILLWAPFGAGEHYWGPGMSAYRLYRIGLPHNVRLYLVHGNRHQKSYPGLFKGIYFVSDLKNGNFVSQLLFLIRSYLWIRRNFKKFDIVHVLGAHEISLRPALWFEQNGIPAFSKITGDRGGLVGHSRLSKLLGVSKNRISNLNHITGYIAISEAIKVNLSKIGVLEHKIFCIPNGVDTEVFKPVNPEQKAVLRKQHNLKNRFTVIFVGGISSRKQPLMLIKAFKRVIAAIEADIQLILLGPDRDGSTLIEINKWIYENSIQDFVSHVEHSDIPQIYYQMADIFCLPSKSEGMSNALLEAMSSGLPSIVTAISGSRDLIQNTECGIIVENERDISNAIQFYFNNYAIAEQHSKNARTLILNKYASSIVLKQHLELFSIFKKPFRITT
ncbi:MAG: glycosyltransferase family 4 protein [Pseudomonadota bacterium]